MSYFGNIAAAFMGQGVSDLPSDWKRGDPSDDFYYTDGKRIGRNAAKTNVTVARARRVPVVRDCLQVLSQTVGNLPFNVYQWRSEDERRRVEGHPIMRLLQNPHPEMTPVEFFETLTDDLAAWGYFVAVPDQVPFPTQLERLDPACTTVEKLTDGSLRFRYRENGMPEKTYLRSEVWYIPVPPLRQRNYGTSPILDDGVEALGAVIGMNDYANSFWANDATPPFLFKHPGQFKDKETRSTFLRGWYSLLTGRNRGKPGMLEYGIEIEKMGLTNEQSQFLETKKELLLDVSRIWRMPPHKVGILDRATFSNIEQQSLEFVVDTVMPWLRLIESSINKWLLNDPQFYFNFDVTGLLRGDTKTRFEAYQMGRQWGWLSVNEIRARENMNRIAQGGDEYLVPLNMVPAGDAGTSNDPDRRTASGIDDRYRAMDVLHATVGRAPQKALPAVASVSYHELQEGVRPTLVVNNA